MESFSSFAGINDVGPKKDSESWSEYWNRKKHVVSGMVGSRFRRKQDAEAKKQRNDDLLQLIISVCLPSLFNNSVQEKKENLPEKKWDRKLKNTLALATPFMVPYALSANNLEEEPEPELSAA